MYNLYSPASRLLGIFSSPHCKMGLIIVKRGTYEDACKHLTTALKYHNPDHAYISPRNVQNIHYRTWSGPHIRGPHTNKNYLSFAM